MSTLMPGWAARVGCQGLSVAGVQVAARTAGLLGSKISPSGTWLYEEDTPINQGLLGRRLAASAR